MPLLSPSRADYRVVLDPGHGGLGPIGRSSANRAEGPTGTLEKDIVFDIAQRLSAVLDDEPIDILLTRDGDANASIADRVGRARACEADAFVSLHLGDGSIAEQGTCTFVHDTADAESRSLAEALHAELLADLQLPDLGVRGAPLAVLHPRWHAPRTAACLLELSVLSDPAEEFRLRDPAYRDRIAMRLGSALRRWLVHWRNRQTAPTTGTSTRRRALVVGVDRYADASLNLHYAVRDAHAVRDTMVAGFGLRAEDIVLLTDGEATGPGIVDRLRQLARDSAAGDAVLFYFAGRGSVEGGRPAVVAADGAKLTATQLHEAVAGTHVHTLMVMTDSGMSTTASAAGSRSAPGSTVAPVEERAFELPESMHWISAAAPGQDAVEHAELGHGLFTRCLLDRILGGFDITLGMLRRRLERDMQNRVLRLNVPVDARPWLQTAAETTRFPQLAPDPGSLAVHVDHYVPLVAQCTGMSCWAAGAAMLIGWRDCIAVKGEEVARGAGRWAEFEQGLAPHDIESLANTWELKAETARTWTVPELARMLERSGPLWIGEADPELHVVVITGLSGDGTVDGTDVMIADPWPVNRGERYVLPFRELMSNFELANDLVGLHAQILHTGGRPPVEITRNSHADGDHRDARAIVH